MAYSFQSRTVREQLIEESENDKFLDAASSSEEYDVSEDNADSDFDFSSSSSIESSMEENGNDLENAILEQRILQVRARQVVRQDGSP